MSENRKINANKARSSDDHLSVGSGGLYEIIIKGQIDEQWSGWFGDLTVTHDESDNTILSGFIADQSELHGILAKIRDLNLMLVSLKIQETETDRLE